MLIDVSKYVLLIPKKRNLFSSKFSIEHFENRKWSICFYQKGCGSFLKMIFKNFSSVKETKKIIALIFFRFFYSRFSNALMWWCRILVSNDLLRGSKALFFWRKIFFLILRKKFFHTHWKDGKKTFRKIPKGIEFFFTA